MHIFENDMIKDWLVCFTWFIAIQCWASWMELNSANAYCIEIPEKVSVLDLLYRYISIYTQKWYRSDKIVL